jgi:hypothetical protein
LALYVFRHLCVPWVPGSHGPGTYVSFMVLPLMVIDYGLRHLGSTSRIHGSLGLALNLESQTVGAVRFASSFGTRLGMPLVT